MAVQAVVHWQSPSLSGPLLVADGHTDGGGTGVGARVGVGGAPPSPTYRSALVSPDLKPVMTFNAALSSSSS